MDNSVHLMKSIVHSSVNGMDNTDDTHFEENIKKKSIENVVEMIRGMIDAGVLSPGDQLAPERELAIQLGVSRAAVRDAIRALELMGEVETRIGVGGGTFICNITFNHALNTVFSLFRRTNQMLSDVVEVRLILETRSAALAAERRTERDLNSIDSALHNMADDIIAGSIGIRPDHAFHLAIAKASGNEFLYGLSQLVEDMIVQTRKQTLSRRGVPSEALEDHEKIAQAIRCGDAPLAENLMREHLLKAYKISKES